MGFWDSIGKSALKSFGGSVAGGLGGMLINSLTGNTSADADRRQREMMQYQNEMQKELMNLQLQNQQTLNKESYERQRELNQISMDENRYLRSTANQVTTSDMDKAGINRNALGAQGVNASSSPASGSSPGGSAFGGSAGAGMLSRPSDMSVSEALQASKLQAEIDNIKADTYNKENEGDVFAEKAKQESIITKFTERFQIAGLNNANAEWAERLSHNQLLMKQVSEIDSQIKINEELVKKITAETAVLNEEQKIKHAEAIVADEYWKQQIELIGAQVGWTKQQTADLAATLPYRLAGLSMNVALMKSEIDVNSARARELGLICDGLGISNYVAKQSAPADIKKRKNEAAKSYYDAKQSKTSSERAEGEWQSDKNHLTYRSWAKDFQMAADVVETGTRAGKNVADTYNSVRGSIPDQMNAQTNRNNSQINQYNAKTKAGAEYRKRQVARQVHGVKF